MGSRDGWIPKAIQPSEWASEILSQGSKVREQERKTLSPSALFMYTHGLMHLHTYVHVIICTCNTAHTKEFFFKELVYSLYLLSYLIGLLDFLTFCGCFGFIIYILILCQTSSNKDFLQSCRVYFHLVIWFCCCTKFFFVIACFPFSVSALYSKWL